MSLQKNNLPINFLKGLDEKSDPFQVAPGNFLALSNSIFTKGGLLQKRNGFIELAALPDDASFLTTFNGNLTAVGSTLQAYAAGSNTWVNKGALQPLSLKTLPIVRSSTAQTQADAAVSSNGLVCVAYTDQIPTAGSNVATYKYSVLDATTGQALIDPTVISGATTAPRAFAVGKYFLVVYGAASNNLKYIAINITTLAVGSAVTVSSAFEAGSFIGFNGVTANNSLYLAWRGISAGNIGHVTYIDSTLTQHGVVTFSSRHVETITLCADITTSTPTIWIISYEHSTGPTVQGVFARAYSPALVAISTSTATTTSSAFNTAATASDGICTVFYEVPATYSYDSSIATDYINKSICVIAGGIGTESLVGRGLGIASNAFTDSAGTPYLLAAYQSAYQPTYFVIDSLGNIAGKLAYSNGGGYVSIGSVPNPTKIGDTVYFPFLYKDLIQSVNKTQGLTNSTGVYSQTGVNLATVELNTSAVTTSEIGSALNISGGFLWQYDGVNPVEQGFFLWPESIEATGSSTSGSMTAQEYFYQVTYEWAGNSGNVERSAPSIPLSFTILTPPATVTGLRTSGSPIITGIASTALLQVGQAISGTGIPGSTFILSVDSGTQITMTANASSGSATSTVITPITATSATINIPTLRVTYKDNVKIVVYRWSVGQQSYYQTTSLTIPTLNDKTTDSVAFVDTHSDAQILGNNIIYTNGGVIENISAPATDVTTLFKSRLILVDAEDRNLLWYSKQVIEATPVEMSDLFTIYVAPTIGAQGNSGPISALGAMDDKLIIFKADAIYYIAGDGPDNTGANSTFTEPQFITGTVGCSNQHSIVMTPDGLMFQSDKGIWLLDRSLQTHYIGAPVEGSNTATVEGALTIPGTNQVRFTLDNGSTLMYDYFWKQWGSFSGIPGVSSTLFEGMHTFINEFGQVFQENPGSYQDGARPVLMSFKTGWINLMGLQGLERAYYFYLLGTYLSPHKLAIGIAYDYAPTASQTFVISPDNYAGPWGAESVWGGGGPWGGPGSLEQWRVFMQQQKCQAFQITLTEIYDSSIGVAPGAGFTLSGLNLVVGAKKSYPTLRPARSAG